MKKQWFAHDPEEGTIFFSTEDEARRQASEWLGSHTEYAATDGWHEFVDEVCYGKVTHAATAINLTQRPEILDEDGCDEDSVYWETGIDFKCDYEIQNCEPVASVPQDEWTFDELDLRGPGDFMTTPPEGWESSDWRTCLELKAELHNKRVYRAEIKRLRALIANRDSTQSGPQDEQAICQCTADESTGWTQWPVCNVCSKIVEGVELSQGAEIQRLTECLQKANIQAEHFEREWYLRGDEIEKLKSTTQEVDEFIAANREVLPCAFSMDGPPFRGVSETSIRAWMAGHARVPVESSDIEIEFEWSSKGKAIFCRDGTYFALKPEEFPAMHKAMLAASQQEGV